VAIRPVNRPVGVDQIPQPHDGRSGRVPVSRLS
jgi:hypothetical protein